MSSTLRRARTALAALVAGAAAAGCAGDPPTETPAHAGEPTVVSAERMLMGTRFAVQVVAADGEHAEQVVELAFAEIARVEALLSEWQESSEISAVNRAAGRGPVTVGPELFEVVERSLWASRVTDGAFDVTFAGCGRLWSFAEARRPSPEALSRCLEHVGYGRIELDATASTIHLPDGAMRIGIAGIGKGYGIDRGAAAIEAAGLDSYIVDGGGDIRLRGRKPDGPWTVGVAHPRRPGTLYGALAPGDGAIVTSGDYQSYFELDGERFHHILDPSTGMPARRAAAVTVIAATAMDADALATGLFVLGPERGLGVVEALPGVEALFFDDRLEVRTSGGFPPFASQ